MSKQLKNIANVPKEVVDFIVAYGHVYDYSINENDELIGKIFLPLVFDGTYRKDGELLSVTHILDESNKDMAFAMNVTFVPIVTEKSEIST